MGEKCEQVRCMEGLLDRNQDSPAFVEEEKKMIQLSLSSVLHNLHGKR